jgi:predicted ArsR family transcriptional regulator
MLQQLVRLVAGSDVQSVATLAQALDATPELVEQMLEQLETQGYLERQVIGCVATACQHCAYAGQCGPDGRAAGVRGWSLTAKGKQLAARG